MSVESSHSWFLDELRADVWMTILIQGLMLIGSNLLICFILPRALFTINNSWLLTLILGVPTTIFGWYLLKNFRKLKGILEDIRSPELITRQYKLKRVKRRFNDTYNTYDYFVISFKSGPEFHLKNKRKHGLQISQDYLIRTFRNSGAVYEVRSRQNKIIIPHTDISYS